MAYRSASLSLGFGLLLGSLATPGSALADEVAGTRSADLVETAHEIDVTLDHGVATLRVRRTVHNGGERHDQAMFWIDVPQTAVATGLRTRGTLHGRPHWFDGELLEAEHAAERYRELTGIGGYYPKDPALLSWRSPELLALQVFPVAPDDDKMIEYTLTMPTRYEDGQDHVTLPRLGTEDRPARVFVSPADRRDQAFVDGAPVAPGFVLTLDDEHTLSLARHDAPRIDANLASVGFADERVLMRYDLALPRRISTIPPRARVVVVIDGSRSLEPDEREAAVAAARAYLHHFEDPKLQARVEVLVFDHEVRARHGRLVPAREARADLMHLTLPEANGSDVDEALRQASDVLAAGPSGPRRILLLTDARTRDGLRPERLRALAERSGAVVHVGIVEVGEPALERDDAHDWAPAAIATGGVVWQLAADPSDGADQAEAVFEELARPMRLHHLQVSMPPLVDLPFEVPEQLAEGQGLEALDIVDQSIEHLRIEGELWSSPVRETVFADAAHGKRWAALVFGSEVREQLTEEEMMPLAMLGGAVSPVTSYLAIEPGVRPSTEGLDDFESLSGFGIGGAFGMGGAGLRGVGHGGGSDRRQAFLESAVRDALDACGGSGLAVRVQLQTTLEEIVAIDAISVPDASDPSIEPCLETGVWEVMPGLQFRDDWKRWTVDLPKT